MQIYLIFKVVCNNGKPLPPQMTGTHIEQKNGWKSTLATNDLEYQVEIIALTETWHNNNPSWEWEVQGFPNSIKGCVCVCVGGGGGGWEVLLIGIFLLGGGNLSKKDFDRSNLFQSKKQHSVNTEHQIKPKLAWAMQTNSIKLK